jgi:hypothetical protein
MKKETLLFSDYDMCVVLEETRENGGKKHTLFDSIRQAMEYINNHGLAVTVNDCILEGGVK